MFTLGNKEAIVNDLNHFPTTYTDNGDATSNLVIKGFGTFKAGSIKDASIIKQEFYPETFGAGVLAVPSAATIGVVGVRQPVTFLIRVNTSRYSSEWATDFIKRGRPFVFELNLDATDTAAQVATKLVAAFAEYELKFNTTDYTSGSLPWNWAISTANVTMTLKAGYLSFQQTTTFMLKNDTFGLDVLLTKDPIETVALANITGLVLTTADGSKYSLGMPIEIVQTAGTVTTTVTAISGNAVTVAAITNDTQNALVSRLFAGTEANVDGKYLEENVTMSTQYTDGAYTIAPGERPLIGSSYVTVSFEATSPTGGSGGWAGHKRLFTDAVDVDASSIPMVSKFTLYFNSSVFGTIASPTATTQLADIVGFLADAVV